MAVFLAKRLLLLIPTTLGAVSLVFFAIRLVPGDPLGGYWLYRMWLA